jgi:ubiquinone/menaquinone biosynthesis C-methylase UbiE
MDKGQPMWRRDMKIWHQEVDFWEKFAPFLFTEKHWETAAEDVNHLLELLHVQEGDAILDVCCGPGRHSLELARRGCKVTGVDVTSSYLREARSRAGEEGLGIEFVHEDARRFCRLAAFHGALLMYTSFGYFQEQEDNLQVLRNIQKSLKTGGKLVIDVMGKEVLARIFQEKGWEEQDGIFFLQERKISEDWRWIENRWILLDGSDRYEVEVSHWLYSAAELSSLLKEAGFESIQCYGNLAGSVYDHNARRLVCVAQR